MHMQHGNTTTLRFTNTTGISTKSVSVEEHAGEGFHVVIESRHTARIRKAAMAASLDGYRWFFGPDRPVASAGIALVAHEQHAAGVRLIAPNSAGARRLYEEGRLAVFAANMSCGQRGNTDRGEVTLYIIGVYGYVNELARTEELLRIVEQWIVELGPVPVVMGGDLNVETAQSSTLDKWTYGGGMVDIGLQSAEAAGKQAAPTCWTSHGKRARRIDYVMANAVAIEVTHGFKHYPDMYANHASLEVQVDFGEMYRGGHIRVKPRPFPSPVMEEGDGELQELLPVIRN